MKTFGGELNMTGPSQDLEAEQRTWTWAGLAADP